MHLMNSLVSSIKYGTPGPIIFLGNPDSPGIQQTGHHPKGFIATWVQDLETAF